MKKVTMNTPEKVEKVKSITDRMTEAINKQDELQKKLEEGIITDQEIEDYVEIDKKIDKIHQELKYFIEKYGE